MTYKETEHKHQSEFLVFLPINYMPIKKDGKSMVFGVIYLNGNEIDVRYQKEIPQFGGYISDKENIYGNPTFCRNATRNHIKHLRLYGTMPHLVFFDNEEAAIEVGFRKCKVCTK